MLPILKAEGPKIEAIKNNTSLSGMQKMEQLRAIHNESAPQLQKILSPAQYQKLQAIRKQEIEEAIAKKRAGAVVQAEETVRHIFPCSGQAGRALSRPFPRHVRSNCVVRWNTSMVSMGAATITNTGSRPA